MDKSRFFESSGGSESFDSVHETYVHFVDDEGNRQLHCVETSEDPLSLLSFDDFSLSQMIKNGISYKSLNITPDMRLGHEKDFDALAKRFDSMSKQMFVETKTE